MYLIIIVLSLHPSETEHVKDVKEICFETSGVCGTALDLLMEQAHSSRLMLHRLFIKSTCNERSIANSTLKMKRWKKNLNVEICTLILMLI